MFQRAEYKINTEFLLPLHQNNKVLAPRTPINGLPASHIPLPLVSYEKENETVTSHALFLICF
jgi:hypothetical protein